MPLTTSLIWPTRPSGIILASASQLSGARIGAWMLAGDTALTRIPRDAYPIASDLVAEARPPLGRSRRRVVGERLGTEHSSVVYQGIDTPEALERPVDDPFGGAWHSDVSLDGEHVRSSDGLIVRAFATTAQPSRRYAATTLAPMPWESPVMMATLCPFPLMSRSPPGRSGAG